MEMGGEIFGNLQTGGPLQLASKAKLKWFSFLSHLRI